MSVWPYPIPNEIKNPPYRGKGAKKKTYRLRQGRYCSMKEAQALAQKMITWIYGASSMDEEGNNALEAFANVVSGERTHSSNPGLSDRTLGLMAKNVFKTPLWKVTESQKRALKWLIMRVGRYSGDTYDWLWDRRTGDDQGVVREWWASMIRLIPPEKLSTVVWPEADKGSFRKKRGESLKDFKKRIHGKKNPYPGDVNRLINEGWAKTRTYFGPHLSEMWKRFVPSGCRSADDSSPAYSLMVIEQGVGSGRWYWETREGGLTVGRGEAASLAEGADRSIEAMDPKMLRVYERDFHPDLLKAHERRRGKDESLYDFKKRIHGKKNPLARYKPPSERGKFYRSHEEGLKLADRLIRWLTICSAVTGRHKRALSDMADAISGSPKRHSSPEIAEVTLRNAARYVFEHPSSADVTEGQKWAIKWLVGKVPGYSDMGSWWKAYESVDVWDNPYDYIWNERETLRGGYPFPLSEWWAEMFMRLPPEKISNVKWPDLEGEGLRKKRGESLKDFKKRIHGKKNPYPGDVNRLINEGWEKRGDGSWKRFVPKLGSSPYRSKQGLLAYVLHVIEIWNERDVGSGRWAWRTRDVVSGKEWEGEAASLAEGADRSIEAMEEHWPTMSHVYERDFHPYPLKAHERRRGKDESLYDFKKRIHGKKNPSDQKMLAQAWADLYEKRTKAILDPSAPMDPYDMVPEYRVSSTELRDMGKEKFNIPTSEWLEEEWVEGFLRESMKEAINRGFGDYLYRVLDVTLSGSSLSKDRAKRLLGPTLYRKGRKIAKAWKADQDKQDLEW